MLKMEFKFEYTTLTKKVPVYFSKSLENVREISGLFSGKVKKIEAREKLWPSDKKYVKLLFV